MRHLQCLALSSCRLLSFTPELAIVVPECTASAASQCDKSCISWSIYIQSRDDEAGQKGKVKDRRSEGEPNMKDREKDRQRAKDRDSEGE